MPKLKVDTWKCTNEYGFIQVSGSVRNMTNQPIDNLMIYGIFSTKNGEFVKDTSAMVEFLPLMPGQKSPFTALTSYNPAGSKCEIVFKEMFGGVVSHSD